jgi:hypothetical protein
VRGCALSHVYMRAHGVNVCIPGIRCEYMLYWLVLCMDIAPMHQNEV